MKWPTKDNLTLAVVSALFVLLMLLVGGCDRHSDTSGAQPPRQLDRHQVRHLATVRLVPRCGRRCRHVRHHARTYGLAEVPASDRHWNYGGGSCVFASIANTLEILGLGEQANHITATYSGGEDAAGLHAKLDALAWDYATTTDGDEAILDWCDRTGRGAMITWKADHVCGFLGYDRGHAVILDPNRADVYEYCPKEEFLARWRWRGGWATAIVADPVP
jgi:hypothetical protein